MLESSVDDESLAGDQTCSVAEEEDRRVGDVLDDTLAPEGNLGVDEAWRARSTKAGHPFGTDDRSRSDNVRANAPRSLLDGNHTRESVNASLGGRDVSLVWSACQNEVNTRFPAQTNAQEGFTSVVKGGADVDV